MISHLQTQSMVPKFLSNSNPFACVMRKNNHSNLRWYAMRSHKKRSVTVVWFKRDLRSSMNHALLQGVVSEWPVLPLYIVEPEYWSQPDASHRHYQFMSECLAELRADLAAIGQPLILRVGAARA